MKNEVINSPIRWAGSKKKILNNMLILFDQKSEYYIEPFLGSGVVLINLINNIEEFNFKKFFVNDINSNIINFYILLRDKRDEFIKKVENITKKYNALNCTDKKEEFYYCTREKYNKLNKNNEKKAIYFYFLMKTGYNGVYRENKLGCFNVPFGKKEKIVCNVEYLRNISEKIKKVEFYNYDYERFFEVVNRDNILTKSFVYFDPPYIPEEKVINKKQELYTNENFNHEKFVKNIENLNINKFLISMSESKKANKIYKNYKKYIIDDITRTVNPKKIISSKEIVFANYSIKNNLSK